MYADGSSASGNFTRSSVQCSMTLKLRLLVGLLILTREGFSLALDECGSSIAALRGFLGRLNRLKYGFIDRMMVTLTRNTSGRYGDVSVKAQSSSLQRRVLAGLLSIIRHMRLSFCAFERLRLSSDMEKPVPNQLIAYLVMNAQDCSHLRYTTFICSTYPIHGAHSVSFWRTVSGRCPIQAYTT